MDINIIEYSLFRYFIMLWCTIDHNFRSFWLVGHIWALFPSLSQNPRSGPKRLARRDSRTTLQWKSPPPHLTSLLTAQAIFTKWYQMYINISRKHAKLNNQTKILKCLKLPTPVTEQKPSGRCTRRTSWECRFGPNRLTRPEGPNFNRLRPGMAPVAATHLGQQNEENDQYRV